MSFSFTSFFLVVVFFVSYIAAHDLTVFTPTDSQNLVLGTRVSTTWNSSDDPGHTLAILLQQGNHTVPGQVSVKIATIVYNNVPNTGSWVWTLDPKLPSGNDYYIRIQSGTADDWGGGVGDASSAPSPTDVYGFSSYFNIVPSTVLPSSSATPVPTSPASTSKSSHGTNVGVIVGPILGGLAALGLLGLLFFLRRPNDSETQVSFSIIIRHSYVSSRIGVNYYLWTAAIAWGLSRQSPQFHLFTPFAPTATGGERKKESGPGSLKFLK
jgi:Ser-Thr-rich glycosyl-phosphatidyl-inositol-anchored membrane family